MLTRTSQQIRQAVDTGRVAVDLAQGLVIGSRGRALRPRVDRGGYLTVSLAGQHLPLHRIVAYAAYGEQALAVGMAVRHKDGDNKNNTAANLEVIPLAVSRRPRVAVLPAMPWPVTDPANGQMVARFTRREQAEEYARWKYKVETYKESSLGRSR
ncbi:MAG TPA: HNH endonuclease [Longilinea sp.]|nr:HNH endonuclease [Longilinea sp.]